MDIVYTCRNCESELNQGTEVCPYCGEDLTVAPPLESAGPNTSTKKRSLVKTSLIWAILIAALWAIIWYVLPPRPETAKPNAETTALAAVASLQTSLSSYATAAGGYPSSLEALGDLAKSAIRAAASAGYEIQFTPANPNGSGQISGYVLLCRPSNYGYRNFYTDETRIIRSTRENRTASVQDPAIR
jgi:hypothetical protein